MNNRGTLELTVKINAPEDLTDDSLVRFVIPADQFHGRKLILLNAVVKKIRGYRYLYELQ